jgi:hypothetical protein
MRPEDVLYWTRAAPFQPFRMRLVSGKTYDIRHPEMVRVGRSSLIVFSFSGEASDPYERLEMVSMGLIERIEPLETAAKT